MKLPYVSFKVIRTEQDIQDLDDLSKESSLKLITNIKKIIAEDNLMDSFKYQSIGFDPWNPQSPMHIIEHINIHSTYQVALMAVRDLMIKHPGNIWHLAPGTTAGGPDIHSDNQEIIAEVFAAVDSNNNKKLSKDFQRLLNFAGKHKYLYYKTASNSPLNFPSLAEIQVIKLENKLSL